jgi:DNA topoisomerase-2
MMHDDEESDFDLSDSENPAPVSKTSASSKGLSVISVNVPPKKNNGKTIENQYRKLTQREHCLVRPDTYIGSVEPITDTMFVLDEATDRIVSREITYTPGLYKIFDESEY